MTGSKKRADKKASAGKRRPGQGSKSDFTPEELKFWPRFLSSSLGRLLIGSTVSVLLLALLALIAGKNINLFFLLTGLALLAAMVAFWLLLLFKRSARQD